MLNEHGGYLAQPRHTTPSPSEKPSSPQSSSSACSRWGEASEARFLPWALREVHSEKNSALALALRAQLPLGAGWLLYTLQLPDPTGSVVSWGWPEATKGLPLVWRFPGPRQRCGRSESTLASPHGPKKWLCSSDDVFPLQRLYLGGP